MGGPRDTQYLFEDFLKDVKTLKQKREASHAFYSVAAASAQPIAA